MRILAFLFLITMISCEKEDHSPERPDESELPDCVADLLSTADGTDYSWVEEWTLDDGVYYYFTAECCDNLNLLYSSDCEYICAPDGGFSGNGKGDCTAIPDVFERRVIWSRPE